MSYLGKFYLLQKIITNFTKEIKDAMPGKAEKERKEFHENFDNTVKKTAGKSDEQISSKAVAEK